MFLDNIIFYFLTVSLIFFAILAVNSQNRIKGLLFLVPFICSLAGILITLGFEFVALSLTFIELSAVAVVILFTIMIEEKNMIVYRPQKNLLTFFIASLIIVLLINLIVAFFDCELISHLAFLNTNMLSLLELGKSLFYEHSFLFQISGIILFCGATGAVMLVYAIEPVETDKVKKTSHKNQEEAQSKV